MIVRERMEQEIQLARQIQKTFLPESLPELEGWKLDLRWSTAREVGGDFYDIFFISNGKIVVVIADVSDKGMPAALYMTVTRTLIRSSAKDLCSPSRILTHVNDLLASENQSSGMFVTTALAVIEPETGLLTYSIAGHNLPLLWRAESRKVESLKKGGIALGVIEDPQYTEHETRLEPGDELLFYTDGVTETFSPTDDQFSESGLNTAFLESREQNRKNTLEYIEDKLSEFRGNLPLADDITMISLTRQKKDPA
jgi:serine phosphatase RsbU (regulator of sigma subunit)